jgi:hypothetical protein
MAEAAEVDGRDWRENAVRAPAPDRRLRRSNRKRNLDGTVSGSMLLYTGSPPRTILDVSASYPS